MSSTYAASTATKIQQSATTTPQQKTQLPNPFDLEDYEILHKVYLTHVNDDEVCDKDVLFNLVSNTILGSTQISGTAVVNSQIPATSFKPDFPALKRISCQMITTRGTAQCAHQTTIWILQHLRCFSWDAKALITLAAFSLEYGEFWHLYRIPTSDSLGNSLKQLNQVQNRKDSTTEITELVTFLVEVFQYIKEWATWSAIGYDTEEVHSLSDALQEIPLVVYWAVATIVACIGNLVGVSEYKLSDFKLRLSPIVIKLKGHLRNCKVEIGRIEDYRSRMNASKNIKDVVDFLKLLILGNGSQTHRLYEGNIQVKTGIEVFKQKHVLLFISGLDSIGDEIMLLNSIYNRLQENPKEAIKGFKKEDFKILWIPIVDTWDDFLKEQFRTLKEGMKWYVLEYFDELPGRGIIREKLKYDDSKPIVSVINPQGEIINENAMDIIFQWGIEAFPFRKSDAEDLLKKWAWFWNLMKKVDINIEDIKRDSYIFIYGGTDSTWIRDFTVAIGKIKKHERIKNVDVTIEHYQLGKDNPARVPYFWIGVDGKKLNKKCQDRVDCEIQEAVKSLLCLKQDPLGWVLLSKGYHITLLGHGEPMYQTVADFEIWKEKMLEKESFDVAFKEYYNGKLKEMYARHPCAYLNVDNYASNVLATITCPNPTCGRVMEVTSVNYRCCHRDDQNSCSI